MPFLWNSSKSKAEKEITRTFSISDMYVEQLADGDVVDPTLIFQKQKKTTTKTREPTP